MIEKIQLQSSIYKVKSSSIGATDPRIPDEDDKNKDRDKNIKKYIKYWLG